MKLKPETCVQTVKFQELEWSLWDRWVLEGDLTVQQVIDWFKVIPQIAAEWCCSKIDAVLLQHTLGW